MEGKGFEAIKVIGKGAFGAAVLCRHLETGKLYVAKEVNLANMKPAEKQEARNEIKVLARLDHPNITRFTDSFEVNSVLYIVMEHADGGDLWARIQQQGTKLMTEELVMHYFVQLCLAMYHMHTQKILHRDLKGQNVFLTKTNMVKLGDFGISIVLRHTMSMAHTKCGTPYYFSPEICTNQPYNHKSDVWSLGCILYELCALRHAFNGNSMNELLAAILKGKYQPLSSMYSDNLRHLVAAMLTVDPRQRPSVEQILNLDFVEGKIKRIVDTGASDITARGAPPRHDLEAVRRRYLMEGQRVRESRDDRRMEDAKRELLQEHRQRKHQVDHREEQEAVERIKKQAVERIQHQNRQRAPAQAGPSRGQAPPQASPREEVEPEPQQQAAPPAMVRRGDRAARAAEAERVMELMLDDQRRKIADERGVAPEQVVGRLEDERNRREAEQRVAARMNENAKEERAGLQERRLKAFLAKQKARRAAAEQLRKEGVDIDLKAVEGPFRVPPTTNQHPALYADDHVPVDVGGSPERIPNVGRGGIAKSKAGVDPRDHLPNRGPLGLPSVPKPAGRGRGGVSMTPRADGIDRKLKELKQVNQSPNEWHLNQLQELEEREAQRLEAEAARLDEQEYQAEQELEMEKAKLRELELQLRQRQQEQVAQLAREKADERVWEEQGWNANLLQEKNQERAIHQVQKHYQQREDELAGYGAPTPPPGGRPRSGRQVPPGHPQLYAPRVDTPYDDEEEEPWTEERYYGRRLSLAPGKVVDYSTALGRRWSVDIGRREHEARQNIVKQEKGQWRTMQVLFRKGQVELGEAENLQAQREEMRLRQQKNEANRQRIEVEREERREREKRDRERERTEALKAHEAEVEEQRQRILLLEKRRQQRHREAEERKKQLAEKKNVVETGEEQEGEAAAGVKFQEEVEVLNPEDVEEADQELNDVRQQLVGVVSVASKYGIITDKPSGDLSGVITVISAAKTTPHLPEVPQQQKETPGGRSELSVVHRPSAAERRKARKTPHALNLDSTAVLDDIANPFNPVEAIEEEDIGAAICSHLSSALIYNEDTREVHQLIVRELHAQKNRRLKPLQKQLSACVGNEGGFMQTLLLYTVSAASKDAWAVLKAVKYVYGGLKAAMEAIWDAPDDGGDEDW